LKPDGKPVAIGDAVARYLSRAGLKERMEQARVIEEWAAVVGPQIAQVTTPQAIARDGTLFVEVTTAAWAQELQLQSPMVLARLKAAGRKVRKIVWRSA
jgi:predicted nucleic acid-binding Zn ribbon protein